MLSPAKIYEKNNRENKPHWCTQKWEYNVMPMYSDSNVKYFFHSLIVYV